MRKLLLSFILILTMLPTSYFAQVTSFCRIIDNPTLTDDVGNKVERTLDGGFVGVGTMRQSASDIDMYAIKYNSSLGIDFSVRMGDIAPVNYRENGYAIVPSGTGAAAVYYVIGSMHENFPSTNIDIFVMKISSTGGMLWAKRYGGLGTDVGTRGILSTNAAGAPILIVTGYTNSNATSDYNMFTLVIDPTNGSFSSFKAYGNYITGTVSLDRANDIIAKPNNAGYILVGDRRIGTNTDAFIVSLDASLNLAGSPNSLYITSAGNETLYSVEEIGGNYYAIGNTNRLGDDDIYLIKFNAAMALLDNKIYGGGHNNQYGTDIIKTYDGKLVISGYETPGTTATAQNGILLKLDPANLPTPMFYRKTTYGTLSDVLNGVCEQNSSYIVSVGRYNSSGTDDFFFNRTSQTGSSCCMTAISIPVTSQSADDKGTLQFAPTITSVNHGRSENFGIVKNLCNGTTTIPNPSNFDSEIVSQLQIVPVPNNGQFKIIVPENYGIVYKINVFNMQGGILKTITNSQDLSELNIDAQELKSGIYFIDVVTEEKTERSKIIVNK